MAADPAPLPPTGSHAVDHAVLRVLSSIYPTAAAALAELAALRASLTLPARTVHVISDVHGEHAKLRHVVNNASGALRPMVAGMLNGSLTEAEQRELLSVIYYPAETMAALRPRLVDEGTRGEWVRKTLQRQFELVRLLSRTWRRSDFNALLPSAFAELFKELYAQPLGVRPAAFLDLMLGAFELQDQDWAAVRAASRLVRNLSAAEILVAGDMGDRGPRLDKVIDFLMRQPNVRIVWGNHDAHWMGACLGQEACIASVVRFSLKYGRTAQLEEGYGISLDPLEALADAEYAEDLAERFRVTHSGGRSAQQMARMLKAVTVLQLKLEGQLIRRWPEWGLGHRDLLPAVSLAEGVVEIGGRRMAMAESHLPTVDPADPNRLSEGERRCIERLCASFVGSPRLWQHMDFVVKRGSMWTVRDELLVFHACVPVDRCGEPLTLRVDGSELSGRTLMDQLTAVVHRAFRSGADGMGSGERRDADWLWYLWCGPRSPLFGKDKIATFEGAFVADESAREEHKNPYFELIHDAAFVRKIGRLFGCGADVLVVNGHVPVKLERGEQPVKRGGNAVTIDGAFSEAYGDRGFSLLLTAGGVNLAEHAHFESVEAVIRDGSDIIPRVRTIRGHEPPRKVGDTAEGDAVRGRIRELEALLAAYRTGEISERV